MRTYSPELGISLGEGQCYDSMSLDPQEMVGDVYYRADPNLSDQGKLLAIQRRYHGRQDDYTWTYASGVCGEAEKRHGLITSPNSRMRQVLGAMGFRAAMQYRDLIHIRETSYTIYTPSVGSVAQFCEETVRSSEGGHHLPRIVPFIGEWYKRREFADTLAEGGHLISTKKRHDMDTHLAGLLALSPLCMTFLQARAQLARRNLYSEPELVGDLMVAMDTVTGTGASAPYIKLDVLIKPDPRITGLPTDLGVYEAAQKDYMTYLQTAFRSTE